VAFPTTSVFDNFTRANEGPPPSASWTNDVLGSGASGLEVVSNQLAHGLGIGRKDNWWNPATFGPDTEVYALIGTITGSQCRLYLRLANPGTASSVDGYLYGVNHIGGPANAVYRIDNSVLTQLGASESVTWANGDSIGISMAGSDLLTHKKTGGSWADGVTRTDATYSASGNIGVALEDTDTATLDDFGGGTVVTGGASLASDTPMPIAGRGATW